MRHAARTLMRCSGTALPANWLLLAKLLTLILLTRVLWIAPPYLPFVPLLDRLPAPVLYQRALQTIFLIACAGVLSNRALRASAFAIGAIIVLNILGARPLYQNNLLFCAALLLQIALYSGGTSRGKAPLVLRWQFALIYGGAALNKLLDVDWRTGLFFDHLATTGGLRIVPAVAAHFPPLVIARVLSWSTIAIELGLVALWLMGSWPAMLAWLGILFHASLSGMTGTTFGVFYLAAPAAYLLVSQWPESDVVVFYDGDCGVCDRVRRVFSWLDADSRCEWRAFQRAGDLRGITVAALSERMHVVAGDRIYSGFRAFKILVLLTPAFYLAFAALQLFLIRGDHDPSVAMVIGAAVLAVFFPLFEPLGEWCYDMFAAHRQRFGSPRCATRPSATEDLQHV